MPISRKSDSGKKKRRPSKSRSLALIPGGVPRWVRVYDNEGLTADRYAIVFTGRGAGTSTTPFVRCNAQPNHPQYGIYIRGEERFPYDTENTSWAPAIGRKHKNPAIGRRVAFQDLPAAVQQAVREDYCALWEVEVYLDPLEQLAAIKG